MAAKAGEGAAPPVSFASFRAPAAAPPLETAPVEAAPVVEPRLLLFIAAEPTEGAEQAVRRAALDLAQRTTQPVLLLDLAIPGNRQFDHFASATRLVPRRQPMVAMPRGHAGVQFQRVEGTRLQVSRVEPDPRHFAPVTWQGTAAALPVLLDLFGAVVVAVPDLAAGEQGLALAAAADGVVLVIRRRSTQVATALALRDRIYRAGGKPVGVVMSEVAEGGLMRTLPW